MLENITTEGNAGELTEKEKEELLGFGNAHVEDMDVKMGEAHYTDDSEDGHVSDDNLEDDQGDYGGEKNRDELGSATSVETVTDCYFQIRILTMEKKIRTFNRFTRKKFKVWPIFYLLN